MQGASNRFPTYSSGLISCRLGIQSGGSEAGRPFQISTKPISEKCYCQIQGLREELKTKDGEWLKRFSMSEKEVQCFLDD